MKCDCCQRDVDTDSTRTCLTSHVDLTDIGLDDNEACFDDRFYCLNCLNHYAICKHCQKIFSKKEQIRINILYNPKYKE